MQQILTLISLNLQSSWLTPEYKGQFVYFQNKYKFSLSVINFTWGQNVSKDPV